MVETTLRFLIEQVGQVEGAYLTYLTREFQPYLNAAAKQFSLSYRSMTDRLLDRVSRRIS